MRRHDVRRPECRFSRGRPRPFRFLTLPAILAALLVPAAVAGAQSRASETERIVFEKSQTPGVSNSLLEDRSGFIWIGTDVGLWRYDGYGFKNYSHIVPERIDTGMYQDAYGSIWIGTENGLVVFDPANQTRRTYLHDPDDPESIGSHVFQYKKQVFCEDSDGQLWVATDNGLGRYDRELDRFTTLTRESAYLVDDYVTAILPSRDGLLWVATFRGLQKVDPTTGIVVRYFVGAPNNMYSLAEDEAGTLWIGAYQEGVHRLDPVSGSFSSYRHDPQRPDSLASDVVTFLLIPRESPDSLWVATADGGLTVLDGRSGKATRFVDDPDAPSESGISGNALSHIIQDRSGAIFVLNEHGFLNRVDPGSRRFDRFSCSVGCTGNLPKAAAYSVWVDAEGTPWMVAGARKVSRFDFDSREFHPGGELPEGTTGMVASGCNGAVWLGTVRGIARFDPGFGTIDREIALDGLRLNGLCDSTNPDLLWLGSANAGVLRVDTGSGDVSHVLPEGPDRTKMRVILAQDQDGTIWISTFGVGLQRFDPSTGSVNATFSPADAQLGNPSGFFRDSRGRCWVSFQNGGPARFFPDRGEFVRFEAVAGGPWPARGSTGILEDAIGNLWISGNGSGELVRFDPESGEVRLYTQADGVAPGTAETLNRPPVVDAQGAFWFPGMGGVTRFEPARVRDNLYNAPVFLTELSQDGMPLISSGAVEAAREIVLPPERNYFDFEAVALSFRLPQRNRYQFRLLGRDTSWYDAGTRRSGHYSGLEEGMYILEVRGSNNDGIWSESTARLNVSVEPRIPSEAVVLRHDEVVQGHAVILRQDQRTIVAEVAPLEYGIVESRNYRWLLEGYDSDWRVVSSSRFAVYTRVPPGRYELRVEDQDSGRLFRVPVTVKSPFYDAWWFFPLIAVVVLVASGAFWRERFSHLKRERVEAERHRDEERHLEREKKEAITVRVAALEAREQALEAFHASERRYEDLLATMSEGFAIADRELRLTYANHRFCDLLGYEFEELASRNVTTLVDNPDDATIARNLAKLERGEATAFELGWVRRDGTRIATLVSSKPVLDGSGTLRESYAVVTDITRLKETEQMLRSREQELITEKGNLEEVNTALRVLLRKRDEDIDEVRSRLQRSLTDLVTPYLSRLRDAAEEERRSILVTVIESNLAEITGDLSVGLDPMHLGLTAMEQQIANLIRDGLLTKEIASVLNVSVRTVEFHRANIRKKLGVSGKSGALRSYLGGTPENRETPT